MSDNSMRWPGVNGGPGLDFGSDRDDSLDLNAPERPQPQPNDSATQSPDSVDTPPRGDESTQPTSVPSAPSVPTPARAAGTAGSGSSAVETDDEEALRTHIAPAVSASADTTMAASKPAPAGSASPPSHPTPARAMDPREQASATAFSNEPTDVARDQPAQPTFVERSKQVAAGLSGAAAGAWGTRKDKPDSDAEAESGKATKRAARGRRTRKARLRLARIDPWSVMKTSFLFSIAFGIMTMVVVFVLWSVLQGSGALESLDSFMATLIGDGENNPFHLTDVVTTGRVLGFAAIVAVIDVVLVTAIATLFAFLYNLAATAIGGLEVTLAED